MVHWKWHTVIIMARGSRGGAIFLKESFALYGVFRGVSINYPFDNVLFILFYSPFINFIKEE